MAINGIPPGGGAVSALAKPVANTTADTSTARPSPPGELTQTPRLAENTSLEIHKDKESGVILIRVIDRRTGQTVIEAPPESVVSSMHYLLQQAGVLFDKSA